MSSKRKEKKIKGTDTVHLPPPTEKANSVFLHPLEIFQRSKPGAVTVNPLGNDFQRITYLIVLVSLKKTTATTITQKIVGSYLTPLFRSRVRFKIICQESSDIVDSSYKEATSNLAQTSFVHAGSTAPRVRARKMPFELPARSLLH